MCWKKTSEESKPMAQDMVDFMKDSSKQTANSAAYSMEDQQLQAIFNTNKIQAQNLADAAKQSDSGKKSNQSGKK
jgi:hypothetical protein